MRCFFKASHFYTGATGIINVFRIVPGRGLGLHGDTERGSAENSFYHEAGQKREGSSKVKEISRRYAK